jgi:hypothetical protein
VVKHIKGGMSVMDFVDGLLKMFQESINKDFEETDPYVCYPNGQCIHLSDYQELMDSMCFKDKKEE